MQQDFMIYITVSMVMFAAFCATKGIFAGILAALLWGHSTHFVLNFTIKTVKYLKEMCYWIKKYSHKN